MAHQRVASGFGGMAGPFGSDAAETEESWAVPAGTGDGAGDLGEGGPGLAAPGKALLQHHHGVLFALPSLQDGGAGLVAAFGLQQPVEAVLLMGIGELVEPAAGFGGEAAEHFGLEV